jgi:hypothetical protein
MGSEKELAEGGELASNLLQFGQRLLDQHAGSNPGAETTENQLDSR